MGYKVGEIYNGFKLLEEKNVKEINSVTRIFEHEKTGAKLLSFENDDDNKVFGIGFRTPPSDSTGLPHILEHSVLCGSRKFTSKEPFVELLKGSLNTFLNAMTFSDKTIYPVASKNDKDFHNLMDVYLDAVFYPNIYKYPEIFYQEGWHHELLEKEGEVTYNGVVYNEMKGAFSSPDSILYRRTRRSLFPDNAYGFESGGDPDDIPDLSYEEFIDFHKKYYHPSNSFICLSGNGNLSEQMKFINDEYLIDFDRLQVDSDIPDQSSFTGLREEVVEYPADDLKDNTFLSLNFVTGSSLDPEIYLAFEILEHLLLETPAAPLKKALIDAGIGKEVSGQFDNSIKQPVFSIIVKKANEEEKERFKEIVFETLRNLKESGIDKELIEASSNKLEFLLRESDFHGYPKGLVYYIKALDSWLYGGDPLLHIEYEPALEKVKAAMTSDYFEKLIDKYILSNTHSSLVVLKPAKGILEEKAEELKKKLQDYKASLSEADIDMLIQNTASLKKRQETPDSPEELASIPMLSIEDINPDAEKIIVEDHEEQGIKVIFNPVFTNKIGYMNLMFKTDKVPMELLPYVGLLSSVMGKVSTEEHEYGSLANQININTGGIGFNTRVLMENGKAEVFHPLFTVKTKALIDKLPKAVGLISEMLEKTRFDEKKRIFDIVREVKSRLEGVILSSGHSISAMRALSYMSPKGLYDEIISGLEYFMFLKDIEKNFENKWEEVASNLKKVSGLIFNKENLLINFVADEKDYDSLKNNLEMILQSLGTEKLNAVDYKFNLSAENEGLLTQSKVQFVAKAGNYVKAGYKYNGSMQVMKTIARFDYLWNKVRVQGGAYGVMSSFGRDGNTYIVSYRDPKLKETLSVYDGIEQYLRSFEADEREMTKYIIGTISNLDSPLTPSMRGEVSTINHISKITQDDIQRERQEVINTKTEDIRQFADLLKAVMSQNCICVLGNEAKIKENKDIFNKLVNVFA
jgi:presequence protease